MCGAILTHSFLDRETHVSASDPPAGPLRTMLLAALVLRYDDAGFNHWT